MSTPSAYVAGFAKASLVDPDLAASYIQHTQLGDEQADALIARLHGDPQGHHWIKLGIDGDLAALIHAPSEVRAFFEQAHVVPGWWQPHDALEGCRAFHRHTELFLVAFLSAVLVEGFSTLISKSFSITGKVMDNGEHRLKQNLRHLMEIFMPGGMEPGGDGWKLSVRIRLVHARVRLLLGQSPEWDHAAWGTPLSAAHIAAASTGFSGNLLKQAEVLGVRLSEREQAAFMMIWRYSAHLMGVVPELLFTDKASALRLARMAALCEPPPSLESCQMVHSLINAAPVLAGVKDQKAHRKFTQRIYGFSRELIGDELANQLNYPPRAAFNQVGWFRASNRVDQWLQKVLPPVARSRHMGQFQLMLSLSHYDPDGLRYAMPEKLHAETEPDRR